MRATVTPPTVTLAPGRPVEVTVEVTNTLDVIDGVRAILEADEGLTVEYQPALLPLFPDGTGTLTLTLTGSATFPAGTHHETVRLRSSVDPDSEVECPLEIEVPPVPAGSIETVPTLRSHQTKATYTVVGHNTGNTVLELNLAAADSARRLLATADPSMLTVEPGRSSTADLHVSTRRQWLGTEARRPLTVVATSPDLEVDTGAVFLQRPMIPRGVRTAIILATIVAVWAVVFLFALNRALAQDPLTKDVPPSFYASDSAVHNGSATGALSANLVGSGGPTGGPAPAGAVPKQGTVIGVGGTVSGKVTATSTGQGVGRITVEAVRSTDGGPTLVSSAATASDGTYTLDGLLPGAYQILFTAEGYSDVWWPAAAGEGGARSVHVQALGDTRHVDAVITGHPGSITGTVDTGQTPAAPVTVTVQAEQGAKTNLGTVQTDAAGQYSVPNLPSPGTYDLSFTSPGYQPATDVVELTGGQQGIADTVALSAGNGSISGTVTDNGAPLGGVTITANANGQTVTSATPTTGTVGQFTLPNLPTPATYLLSFSLTGFGTETQAVQLGPGQNLTNLAVPMEGGAGQVSGTVSSASGTPLGGVTVTVNGGGPAVTTQTLTGGSVGSYLVSGLATPATYTFTFSLAGYESQTVGVPLGSSGSATGVNVTLPLESGSITGTVVSQSGNTPLTGVTVTVTDGTNVHTTTTTSSPAGGFSQTGLPPSTYTVTFSLAGYENQTALVPLGPGASANEQITLVPDG